MSADPTVFVVDDDPAMRQSLRWLLQSVGLAVETYATAEAFLTTVDSARPGCLVLDVRMPGMSGLHLQEELKNRGIVLPIIVVTGYAEVPTAVRALKSGAIDFIEKPFSDQLLVDSVRHALELDQEARATEAERSEITARLALLSTREHEVMERVTDGKPNKVIATELGIGEKTVEVHRANVMRKMCVNSVAALIRLVLLARGNTGKP
jgi:two-component system, LuxR family, response regulator FixJ